MNLTPAGVAVVWIAGGVAATLVGSFCCVVVDRLAVPTETHDPETPPDREITPDRETPPDTRWTLRPWAEVLGGRSRCSSCAAPIRPRDNIPIASWVLLGGRCRSCGAEIPAFHPAVEILVPVVTLIMAVAIGPGWDLPAALWLVPPAITLAAIDLRTHLLPTRIIGPTLGVSILLFLAGALGTGESRRLLGALLGAAVLALPLFAAWWVSGAMGFGDVRLALLLGSHVGFAAGAHPPPVVALIALLALLAACLASLLHALLTGRGTGSAIPFGPGLVAGGLLALGAAEPLIAAAHWS